MSIQDTIAAVRATYGATMNDDQCAELCNTVAYQHRNDPEKWGLSYKAGGTHGTRYDGTPVAHDILMNGVTSEGFDILVGAGAQSSPTWGSVGRITSPDRYWVAPIAPQGGGVVTPPVVVPPKPTLKLRDQFAREFGQVNAYYAAPEGLQRPGGMVLNGAADVVAMTQWGYDLMAGAKVEDVLAAIKTSDEWKQKHP